MLEIENVRGNLVAGKLTKCNSFDAGLDVHSAEEVRIPAGESALISTGLFIEVPKGYVGLLWSRSGLSVKYKLEVGAGCIDYGYQGEVKVHLYNHGSNSYLVQEGDKIAQLLTIPVMTTMYMQVSGFSKNSNRGTNGFGHTGK